MKYTIVHSYTSGRKSRAEAGTEQEALEELNLHYSEESVCGESNLYDSNGTWITGRKWNAEDITELP